MNIKFFDTLPSTNEYCKLLDPASVEEFTVICARQQTAGIGQRGNVWVSEAGKNLTFSLILKPTFLAATDQYGLTMMLAVAVAENVDYHLSTSTANANGPDATTTNNAIKTDGSMPVRIKWPNDIYVGDKKICGILVTVQISDAHIAQAICGIGLNVNQTTFPDWVPNPTSLKTESGIDYDPDEVLHSLLRNIEKRLDELRASPSAIRKQYLERLYRRGEESTYIHKGERIRATITDVDQFGRLRLQSESGTLVCDMKEIAFVV